MRSLTIRHNFETAHRLPQLGGKCENLHGHSWWMNLTIDADEVTAIGIIADFGGLKTIMRHWVDTHLDHGAMLGATDSLVLPLTAAGSKLYVFGAPDTPDDPPCEAERFAVGLPWPSVEMVAQLLFRVADALLAPRLPPGAVVRRVDVDETHVNSASYERG